VADGGILVRSRARLYRLATSVFAGAVRVGYNERWRAPAHCGMVYLVRSGTKQPKPFTASAADQARLLHSKSCPLAAFFMCDAQFASVPDFSIGV
jgi:hypothetical protein